MEPDMQDKRPARDRWSDRLEDTTSLHGLLLEDKNASWEKLHTRLQQKPRRISRAWYWAAAACILLLCSIQILFTNDKPFGEEKVLFKSIAKEPVGQIITVPEKKHIIADEALITPEKVITVVTKAATQNNTMHRDEPQQPGNPVADVRVQQEILAATATNSPIENKMPDALAAVTAPLKPTLRVVHINELGDALPQRNTARIDDDGFLKFKIINQQINSRTPATAKTLSFNISKFTTTN